MNWKKLLISPPPTTCWSLDGASVSALKRDAKGVLRSASAALPEECCEVGPIGLQAVDTTQLKTHLEAVQGALAGATRPAVLLPTGWARCHLLEFDDLPRKRSDMEDVLRWRLKRLLPISPGDMRISWVPAGVRDGKKLALCMTGVDRAYAALEKVFKEVGLEPGLLTPGLVALLSREAEGEGARVVVQQEPGFLAIALVHRGATAMLRTKPLPAGMADWTAIHSELRMSWTYLTERVAEERSFVLRIVADEPQAEAELRRWFGERDEVDVLPAPVLPPELAVKNDPALHAARYFTQASVLDGGL